MSSRPGDQRPDGGFPAPWSADASSIDATCYRLDTSELDAASRDRALAFLAARRRPDGTWAEASELAPIVPPWLRLDDEAATAYLSWNAAMMLARAGRLDELPPIEPRGYRQTRWLAAATFLTLGRGEAASSLLDELERDLDGFDADDLAWLRRSLAPFAPLPGRPRLNEAIEAA